MSNEQLVPARLHNGGEWSPEIRVVFDAGQRDADEDSVTRWAPHGHSSAVARVIQIDPGSRPGSSM